MFSNSFQSGFISIFYSIGSNPLSLWDKQVKNGHIRRVIDDEVKSLVLEISGANVATTYITCPIKPRASLGIKLPFLVMIIKNMKKYFTFEIQILDDKNMHRRFRVSNFQSTTKVRPFCTTMPIGLSSGWNQVQFNLADFTKRAYGSTYIETMRVQVHANVRIRRLYFSDTLYSDEDMPNEFKLFGPVTQKKKQEEHKPPKEQVKELPLHVTPKTEEKPAEEFPPPPSPAEEASPSKEAAPEKKASIEEQTQVTEEEKVPPSEIGEGDEQEAKVETAEMLHEEGEITEVKVEGAPEEESAEGSPQKEEVSASPEVTTAEEQAPATDADTVQKPEHTEASEEPSASEVLTEEPAKVGELETTEETVAAEADMIEPTTTDEPPTSELPTESENESPEE